MGPENEVIYVVDDDATVREGLSSLLRAKGKDVQSFACGTEFLKLQRKDTAACLILDLKMPGMNGLQLQSQLAAAGRRIPIIFITAYDSQESRRRALRAGAVAFLAKPFTDHQLLKTIRSAVQPDEGGTKNRA